MSPTKSSANTRKGRDAEARVARFLVSSGWKILDRNYFFRGGELDLVAHDPDGVLVFIEVKSTWKAHTGRALARVSDGKQIRVWRAALGWLAKYGQADCPMRFDVVALTQRDGRWNLEHVPNAFQGPSSCWA